MVKIPYIKIPSVRVGSIDPTSDIGTGGATPASPTPITFLTQWKMMGNSVVHTDEYLTQWKVEGNSVVDNNAILSCGDLGQDGKYHVKISNGVTIYDIPLTEPLRKVGSVADTIEFADGVATLTRKCGYVDLGTLNWGGYSNNRFRAYFVLPLRPSPNVVCQILNTGGYTSVAGSDISISTTQDKIMAYVTLFIGGDSHGFAIRDESFINEQDAMQKLSGIYAVYELETPTTEVIQVSPFPISPTDTYTSANDTPYSAFEYKKNVEIWSCGEYNAIDGKYHILVQPLGGNIADIALDEPLRKVNDIADNIEFADGVTTVTRNLATIKIRDNSWSSPGSSQGAALGFYTDISSKALGYVLLCAGYNTITSGDFYWERPNLSIGSSSVYTHRIYIKDLQYTTLEEFLQGQGDNIILYELETPTTETIQVPQIEEADSYTCVISQGGKAVSWSSFETNSE